MPRAFRHPFLRSTTERAGSSRRKTPHVGVLLGREPAAMHRERVATESLLADVVVFHRAFVAIHAAPEPVGHVLGAALLDRGPAGAAAEHEILPVAVVRIKPGAALDHGLFRRALDDSAHGEHT